jgi:hypothetical protein
MWGEQKVLLEHIMVAEEMVSGDRFCCCEAYHFHIQQYFSYIEAVRFIGGWKQNTRRKPLCHIWIIYNGKWRVLFNIAFLGTCHHILLQWWQVLYTMSGLSIQIQWWQVLYIILDMIYTSNLYTDHLYMYCSFRSNWT